MDEVGLDDRKLVENYLKPLMDANETKFFAHDGEVKDQREVIAWGPRERGLDMAFKLRGSYAPAAVEHSGAIALPVVFALNVEFPDV